MSTRPHELGGRGIRPQPGQVAALAHVPALTCALVTGGWFHPKSKTCPKNAGAASRVEVSSFRPALTDVISAEWKKMGFKPQLVVFILGQGEICV